MFGYKIVPNFRLNQLQTRKFLSKNNNDSKYFQNILLHWYIMYRNRTKEIISNLRK